MDGNFFLNFKNPAAEMQRFVEQLYDFWNSNNLDFAIDILNLKDKKSSNYVYNHTKMYMPKYYEILEERIKSEVSGTDFDYFSTTDYSSGAFDFAHKKHHEIIFCFYCDYWTKTLSFYTAFGFKKINMNLSTTGNPNLSLDIFLIKLFLHFDYTQLINQIEKIKRGEQTENIKYDFSSLTIQIEEEKRRQIVNAKLKEISKNAILAFFSSLCKNKNIAYNIEFEDYDSTFMNLLRLCRNGFCGQQKTELTSV